ncbi:DUF6233 domain-containing protein [Streptomyces sp. NPDC056638]|uniref:DUF6233 domain-containing protein n=1 Tax=Streptomyces sp. NPDC056638 TaxID=3345887 RepID=UPI00369910A3
MIDLPSDLPHLHTLRIWTAACLREIDEAIAEAELREAERKQGEERRPPPPDWVLELGIGAGSPPTEVHAGHCYAIGRKRRAREQAVAALTGGVRACLHCRPDTELGVFD